MKNYSLGIDVGIGSVGVAVIDNDNNIVEYLNSRIFDSSENAKTKNSICQDRRGNRGVRRNIRRRHHRKERLKWLFEKYGIYSKLELDARTEILLENYNKVLNIEANTMLSMARRYIFGACIDYIDHLEKAAKYVKSAKELIERISDELNEVYNAVHILNEHLNKAESIETNKEAAEFYANFVLKDMDELRKHADELDRIVDKKYWPYASYGDLLLRV